MLASSFRLPLLAVVAAGALAACETLPVVVPADGSATVPVAVTGDATVLADQTVATAQEAVCRSALEVETQQTAVRLLTAEPPATGADFQRLRFAVGAENATWTCNVSNTGEVLGVSADADAAATIPAVPA